MKSYFEMFKKIMIERGHDNTERQSLQDIATLLAMLCDEISELVEHVDELVDVMREK